jgi:hypothetical protein
MQDEVIQGKGRRMNERTRDAVITGIKSLHFRDQSGQTTSKRGTAKAANHAAANDDNLTQRGRSVSH